MPRDQPEGASLAVDIWNEMGGEMRWDALPVLCEIHGIIDPETLIAKLLAIRNMQAREHGGQ